MKYAVIFIGFLMIPPDRANAQNPGFDQFDFLIGDWAGTGEGFSSGQSIIQSSFKYMMNKKYIQVANHSVFNPDEKNPDGSTHEDWGMISFDRNRNLYIFRQFHGEGFVNQYVLSKSLSNDTTFIFETEVIENFVTGGAARFTIHKLDNDQIETIFDVSMTGSEYACYGRNHLLRQK